MNNNNSNCYADIFISIIIGIISNTYYLLYARYCLSIISYNDSYNDSELDNIVNLV